MKTQREVWSLVALASLATALACSSPNSGPGAADAGVGPGDPDAMVVSDTDAATPAGACAAGGAGLDCLFELVDEVDGSCDATRLDHLRTSLSARHGSFPVWHQGRALFVSYGASVAVAGEFNDWQADALSTLQLCGSDIYLASTSIVSGRYSYKVVSGGVWSLDPESWAFAYDEFSGNPDGKNSVLNTYDSGLGHLVQPEEEVCSTELGNCRPLTTYLPPGYDAPANAVRDYPVMFMHDGQNIFDDKDCCFGHTGWEVNVTLDTEIAAGRVEPVVIVGFDHAYGNRGDEYAYPVSLGGSQETFMAFQVETVQPTAAGYWRLDGARYYTGGSSLGGVISFNLAFNYPNVYAGAASLSGTFWINEDQNLAIRDLVESKGSVPVSLYMDHGGTVSGGGDNIESNMDIIGLLVTTGWQRGDSPSCTETADSVCYYHDVGASHDELAWRDRSFRFLRYFFSAK